MIIFPILYFITPYTALVQDTTVRYTFLMTIMFVKGFVVIIAFPCTTILLTNSTSSLRILGTVNGFATTFSGLGRAVGPAAAGAVFSWGVDNGYVIAPWWLLGLIAALGVVPPFFIVEGQGPNRGAGIDGGVDEEDSLLGNDGRGDDVAVLDTVDDLDSGSDSGEERLLKKGKGSYGTMSGGGMGNGVSRC